MTLYRQTTMAAPKGRPGLVAKASLLSSQRRPVKGCGKINGCRLGDPLVAERAVGEVASEWVISIA